MTPLHEQIVDESDRLDAIAMRLQRGETPNDVPPSDVVAALARAGLAYGPPLVRSAPRRPGLRQAASEPFLAALFPKADRPSRLALSAGLLQILEFWDESHEAAQEADDLGESRVSAYWHAIAHRREPDPGNAAYWFRRVGRHPVFLRLAEWVAAAQILHKSYSVAGLLNGGAWDPIAFVRFCGDAARDKKIMEHEAMSLQRQEMLLLLDASLAPLIA